MTANLLVRAMKTLLTLFRKEQSELETEINKATSLKQVVKLVENRLNAFERSYIGGLSVVQVRLVKFFLDTLRQSLASFTDTNETASELSGQISNQGKRSPNSFILKLLQILACIGIFVSLFSLTREASGAWMSILLMSLLVGLEVALQFDKDRQENRLDSTQLLEAPQSLVHVDSKFLLDNLAEALSTIDREVAQAEKVQTLGASGIEEMPEILDFLQKLWGASFFENPQMTIELTKLIPQILLEQGIQVQNYRLNDEQSSREYFDFEPSIDRSTKDYVTLTPALLKGERVLRRGRVIEPADRVKD